MERGTVRGDTEGKQLERDGCHASEKQITDEDKQKKTNGGGLAVAAQTRPCGQPNSHERSDFGPSIVKYLLTDPHNLQSHTTNTEPYPPPSNQNPPISHYQTSQQPNIPFLVLNYDRMFSDYMKRLILGSEVQMIHPHKPNQKVLLYFSEDLQYAIVSSLPDCSKKELHRISKATRVIPPPVVSSPKKGYKFSLPTANQQLLFQVEDKNELLSWLQAIHMLILLNNTLK